MSRPSNTLLRLARNLFAGAVEQQAFVDALLEPQASNPALVWLTPRPVPLPFPFDAPYAWQPDFVDRVPISERPGQHPLHDAGGYYCLDISSVFSALVMTPVPERPGLVIDLCAAPGGKCICCWRMLAPELLIANEVIKKRTGALISNLQRCRIPDVVVTTMDSSRMAELCPASASLVIVDAPCSGQSLVAKGKESPGCFHPATINVNANRQRRILGNAARLVAPGGFLAYITCTYAFKENEANVRWLMKNQPQLRATRVPLLSEFRSELADFPCYRLWPQAGMGAGAFAALLHNETEGEPERCPWERLHTVWHSPEEPSPEEYSPDGPAPESGGGAGQPCQGIGDERTDPDEQGSSP